MMANLGIHLASNGMAIFPGMSADEIKYIASFYDEFSTNSLTPGNTDVKTLWNEAYQYIYSANSAIEGLNNSTISTNVKNQLLGEAKFVRAFCYFYLVNLFGDVPKITATDYQSNRSFPRTPATEIYKLITDDLTSSEDLMSATYLSNDKIRPNKWTSAALLSRVYLYNNDWVKAENETSKIINSGMYSLAPNANVFLKSSSETIWQLYPVFVGYTWDAFYFVPSSGSIPNFQITNTLINAFENNDQRKLNWVGTTTVQSQSYYYPSKYKSKQFNGFQEYNIVFRLGEIYLIRAEARAQQDNISKSLEDLNLIRTRAGLPNSMANSKSTLLDSIFHERQVELFSEWGHRWFDLKRTGKIGSILAPLKGTNWQASDTLYPIPLIEIQNNPALKQNPGY
jgi:hypothetical protein